MGPKFSDICLTVEGKHQKNWKQEIDPTGDGTRARCVVWLYVTKQFVQQTARVVIEHADKVLHKNNICQGRG